MVKLFFIFSPVLSAALVPQPRMGEKPGAHVHCNRAEQWCSHSFWLFGIWASFPRQRNKGVPVAVETKLLLFSLTPSSSTVKKTSFLVPASAGFVLFRCFWGWHLFFCLWKGGVESWAAAREKKKKKEGVFPMQSCWLERCLWNLQGRDCFLP